MSQSGPLLARSEAEATLCALAALGRAGDDVLAIGEAPTWLAGVCEIARLRARASSLEGAFDAIGEHTAALLVCAPDAELLAALVELGPAVIAVGPLVGPAAIAIVRVGPEHVELHGGDLGPKRIEALTRALAALAS